MIELFEQDLRTNNRQSSKGNQLKWENNGIWYKADYTGYEGLSEYVISHLLEYSSLGKSEYVVYKPEQIMYKKQEYRGTKSKSFLKDDWQIITIERLFKNAYGESLNTSIWHIGSVRSRLEFLVDSVRKITGLNAFGEYMNKLLTIDALFLNEDRHTHNIAVLMNGRGQFDYCPVFDNGAGLLSDTIMDYPVGEDIYSLMGEVRAKTICTDFDEQLDVSEEMYGENIHFYFTKKDVNNILANADIYAEEQRERVMSVIFSQMNKYKYLFISKDTR
ncbi:MAG: hypothetical protein ACI4D1_11100 [Lachnospira sp.]